MKAFFKVLTVLAALVGVALVIAALTQRCETESEYITIYDGGHETQN